MPETILQKLPEIVFLIVCLTKLFIQSYGHPNQYSRQKGFRSNSQIQNNYRLNFFYVNYSLKKSVTKNEKLH